MCDASVPWYATSTLPKSDKYLSMACLTPSSVVEHVHVELVLGAIYCMLAGWAVQ